VKFLARKDLGHLTPVDETGEEALRKLKFGDVVTVEVKKPRNGKHHRLYWALVGIVHHNQDRYETTEQLHTALKIAAGHYELLTMPNGNEYKIPRSIAFDTMDQLEFSQFYDRVCDLVAKHFLPGVSVEALKAEVESMIGARAA
jgi:hypothetical protein